MLLPFAFITQGLRLNARVQKVVNHIQIVYTIIAWTPITLQITQIAVYYYTDYDHSSLADT